MITNAAIEPTTLESTLLSLFNDMVDTMGAVPDAAEGQLATSASDAFVFDDSEPTLNLSSLAWPESISL